MFPSPAQPDQQLTKRKRGRPPLRRLPPIADSEVIARTIPI